jgi:hypothetical protein
LRIMVRFLSLSGSAVPITVVGSLSSAPALNPV